MRRDTMVQAEAGERVPLDVIEELLESLDMPAVLIDRSGNILLANGASNGYLEAPGGDDGHFNLFRDLLHVDSGVVVGQVENGEHELHLRAALSEGTLNVHLRWLPEREWFFVRLETPDAKEGKKGRGAEEKTTVKALLEEREITYRNLLAAYLRLQEVNRQKTVFLASAAHELKTPLAVIKGYYDLLLSGSLGKLNEKQRDILQESKESCDRLVRLVSMFLNYSTLESGKLVLHLRENDLRDCLLELAGRWNEAFKRKRVRLDISLDDSLPSFKFDYQKVQQAVANLLDNALKHTPSEGKVTLRAEAYFWERRSGQEMRSTDRRREANQVANAVRVAVTDTGSGIAIEHHQSIFEDFVRVDRSSSGMGLGLAIAKRLVQAHRGKIWVNSLPRQGCTFTFLLPIDDSQHSSRIEG